MTDTRAQSITDRLTSAERDRSSAESPPEGRRDPHHHRPREPDSEGPDGAAACRPQVHARQVRVPGRADRNRRPVHAGGGRPARARRAGADGEGDPALGAARPRPRPRGHPRDLRGDRPHARHQGARRRRTACRPDPGRRSGSTASSPISKRSRWWRAPSRRPGARGASTPGSSPSTARAIAHEVGDVIGPHSELVELAWVTLPEAKSLELPVITLSILEELEDRIARGFRARSAGPVLLRAPRPFPPGTRLNLPGAARPLAEILTPPAQSGIEAREFRPGMPGPLRFGEAGR